MFPESPVCTLYDDTKRNGFWVTGGEPGVIEVLKVWKWPIVHRSKFWPICTHSYKITYANTKTTTNVHVHVAYTLKLPIFILNKNSKFLRYSTSFNKYLMKLWMTLLTKVEKEKKKCTHMLCITGCMARPIISLSRVKTSNHDDHFQNRDTTIY